MVDENQFNKELGRLIRAIRLKHGMSLKDVADRTGVTFQQMQKYETGHSGMSLYRLNKISNVFETSFASYVADNLKPSDYRVLEKGKIKKLLLSARSALNDIEKELVKKK